MVAPRTSLAWIDPQAGKLTEFLKLPSGGDTSYAGLVFYDGLLWVSYYSSHEDKTSIYLAKVELPDAPSVSQNSEVRERCLDTLRTAIRSEEFWPSMHAAEALTLAGAGGDVVEALRDRLPVEKDDQHRCGLVRELVRAGDRSQLPILFAILDDTDSAGRTHAAESLFKIVESGDGSQLRAAFDPSQDPRLRMMAAAALARTGNPEALAFLREQLKSEDRETRKLAAFALARDGDSTDEKPLLAALDQETDAVARAYFINALACLGSDRGREELGRLLDSDDPAVRVVVAESVGYSGANEYQSQLVRLLDDPVLDVRVRAAQSLVALSQRARHG